ncbi:MAG: SGNH/GDSL hydrolase family protein [Oscillospiraceae bacterium]
MKRILSIIMAAAVAAACTVTAGAEGSELVVLGDSITSGYGLDGYVSGDNYSAAGSFANMLGADFGGYENFAVDGRTSGELLTALEDADIAAALAGADTVVISIGGNDFLQPMIWFRAR